jgi:hypothetical protein
MVYVCIYICIYIYIWYIFDIVVILISLSTNKFFWLCDVGSTCLALATCCQQLGELTVLNVILAAACVSGLQFFIYSFSPWGQASAATSYVQVIRLTIFCLVTELITVMLL